MNPIHIVTSYLFKINFIIIFVSVHDYQIVFSLQVIRIGVAQSVQCLTTDWTTGWLRFDPRQRRKDFSCNLCVQNGSGAHPASCTMGTGGPFSGGKAWPGRDADHSPLSSVGVIMSPSASMAFSGTALVFIQLILLIFCFFIIFPRVKHASYNITMDTLTKLLFVEDNLIFPFKC
jgi:hypothetical protein